MFDEFARRHTHGYEIQKEKIMSGNSTNKEAELKKLTEDHRAKLRGILVKKEMLKDQSKYGNWHQGSQLNTFKRLGMKKNGEITDMEKASAFINSDGEVLNQSSN